MLCIVIFMNFNSLNISLWTIFIPNSFHVSKNKIGLKKPQNRAFMAKLPGFFTFSRRRKTDLQKKIREMSE